MIMNHLNKFLLLIHAAFTIAGAYGAAPALFEAFLPEGEFVKGATGVVLPPPEIEPYMVKVQAATVADPEWFRAFMKESEAGLPLPYHEKLGLTQEEYKAYREMWDKRAFTPDQAVAVRLEKASDGMWMIRASGEAFPISSLRYDADKKELSSPNGKMEKLANVDAHQDSILGAWKGHEWKHESKTSISQTTENFAIGKLVGKNLGYLVYRIQEVSTSGRKLYDRSIIIQFPTPSSQ